MCESFRGRVEGWVGVKRSGRTQVVSVSVLVESATQVFTSSLCQFFFLVLVHSSSVYRRGVLRERPTKTFNGRLKPVRKPTYY